MKPTWHLSLPQTHTDRSTNTSTLTSLSRRSREFLWGFSWPTQPNGFLFLECLRRIPCGLSFCVYFYTPKDGHKSEWNRQERKRNRPPKYERLVSKFCFAQTWPRVDWPIFFFNHNPTLTNPYHNFYRLSLYYNLFSHSLSLFSSFLIPFHILTFRPTSFPIII